ncbi:diguanylate cyclase [Burkholderia multivorans]|uniref:diguanylate cyclase n=1 Tax=Burkholderia multivorans TaxID=87883 RepID=UPI001C24C568|nr:diguanylate cyclase [Burkholderia multivorans]MBU9226056.1 diguanylate cyclase [Burkholderia multivorans]
MDLFDIVEEQRDAMRLPLYAVTVTAAARVNTPLIAILHWHGFRRETPLELPGIAIPPRPVPGCAIQIGSAWHAFEAVDAMLLDAAWRLGAWELERIERRACTEIGAPASEALACRQAFGDYDSGAPAEQHLVDGAPDRGALMQLAARKGYLRWMFRPVKGGLWRALDERDDTLDADGGRRPPCPVPPRPIVPRPRRAARAARTVYRLGDIRGILLR